MNKCDIFKAECCWCPEKQFIEIYSLYEYRQYNVQYSILQDTEVLSDVTGTSASVYSFSSSCLRRSKVLICLFILCTVLYLKLLIISLFLYLTILHTSLLLLFAYFTSAFRSLICKCLDFLSKDIASSICTWLKFSFTLPSHRQKIWYRYICIYCIQYIIYLGILYLMKIYSPWFHAICIGESLLYG